MTKSKGKKALDEVTTTKRLYTHGGGFAVHIDKEHADAIGASSGDWVIVKIRKGE